MSLPTADAPPALLDRPRPVPPPETVRIEIWNLPNALTLFRIFLVPVLVVVLLTKFSNFLGLAIFLVAAITDFFDGYFARRYNQMTRLGALLDPIADKALLAGVYITLGIAGQLPHWLVILVVLRDVLILGGFALIQATSAPQHLGPLFVSKVNTSVQIALVGKGINAAVISQTLSVSPGAAYTVAAVGTQATGLSLEVFIDSNLLSPGTAKLRVYQLSPDGGSINVASQGQTIMDGVSYQGASEYITLPVGAYTFNVGSSASSTTLPVSATLGANTVTSIFAVGLYSGNPQIQIVSSQAQGLPGVPNTGSNPNASPRPGSVQPFSPWAWPLAGVALLLLVSGVFIRRLGRVK